MRLFGWFRRSADKAATSADTLERLDALERTTKNLRLEWEDTYESLAKVARKLSKREQRALQGEEEHSSPDIAPVVSDDGNLSREQLRARARARGLIR